MAHLFLLLITAMRLMVGMIGVALLGPLVDIMMVHPGMLVAVVVGVR